MAWGSKLNFYIILILSTLEVIDFFSYNLFKGDNCTLSTGSGVCKLMNECPSVLYDNDELEIQPEVTCSYRRHNQIVCCPLGTEPKNTTTKPTVTTTKPIVTTTVPTVTTTERTVTNTGPTVNSSKVDLNTTWWEEFFNRYTECSLPYENLKKKGRDNLPWQKCVEYTQMYWCEQNSNPPGHTVNMTCNEDSGALQTRIIDGDAAKEKEFPHMALLGHKDGSEVVWLAGGTLISELYVLTAAHVLETVIGKVNQVKLGQVDKRVDSPETTYGVENMHHTNYDFIRKCYNDIGLIKLDREVKFSEYIRPACLASAISEDPRDTSRIVTGWGVTHIDNQVGSYILQKVKINVVSPTKCQLANLCPEQEEWDMNRLICAGGNGTKDSCKGDSGGPLQVILKDLHCQYLVQGLVSIGKGCGFKNVPGVYTNISPYIDWIVNITWPNQN